MTLSAVTYHRVSTTDQDPELTRDDLRRAAEDLELSNVVSEAVEAFIQG